MPQQIINTGNIGTFNFDVIFNIYNRTVTFDTSNSTYQGSGTSAVSGIGFEVIDSDGVTLASIDYTTQIPSPSTNPVYVLDLSSVNFAFLFQTYKITGSIKDGNGSIYNTVPVFKTVCQPVNFTDIGYVPGTFQISVDCIDNNLTVKELTLLTYNNSQPTSVSKTGTLYYPTGTISNISFTGTPFTNNVVYTGQYRINCETTATYNLGDGVYVNVTYITNSVFDVTCSDKMADLICCIQQVQTTEKRNCDNAIGAHAKNQLAEISPYLLTGLLKEINGQDASTEAEFIKKTLACNCGVSSIGQNEITPINPSVYNIVIQGAGDVTVGSVTTGSTKTYTVTSKVYQVVKGDTGDLAFTITTDTSVLNTVKYKITFDYTVMAEYILNAIAGNPSLLNQLNSLINATGVNLTGLDGKCVIDLTTANYIFTQAGLTSSTSIVNIVINGTTYNAPSLFANNPSGIQTWLNSLSLGTFSVTYSGGILSVTTLSNPNTISTFTVNTPSLTIQFQSSNKTLTQILQAIIDYECNLTALQVALGNALSLCYFDYNGNVVQMNFGSGQSQGSFNTGIASVICNLVGRINNLTALTCSNIAALFADSANSSFSGNARLYGHDGTNCVGFTNKQIALGIINAVNSFSDVKTAFCAIDCTSPATCPEIANINASVVSGNIGIYGVTYGTTPNATQTVTVKYKLSSSTTYIVSTNSLQIFPNGNLVGTTPYLINGLTAGQTYDVLVVNNCGGNGFVKQITIPTSSVFTGSFLLGNVVYTVCGASPTTLYSSSPFATGVTMYTNVGLTTPVTGFIYIVDSGGNIFNIDTSTGVVGTDTGSNCSVGTAGTYQLGNSTSTICASSNVTLYSNGTLVIGGTLYTDSGLTTPITGSSFVVVVSSGHIYNLNSSTGQLISDTGLLCSTTMIVSNNNSSLYDITQVLGVSGYTLPGTLTPGQQDNSNTHGSFTGPIGITVVDDPGGICRCSLFVNGSFIECISITGGIGTHYFSSHTYNAPDFIFITLEAGTC